jgi:ferrous iron transport protein B
MLPNYEENMYDQPPPKKVTLALAGNPNAGKTTIFNALTGARQHVGNWPGVTVEKKEGTVNHAGSDIHVVDLPGTYSLTAYSLEEIIARQFIVQSAPDVVVDVVDASNLERNLYLSVQLLEMGAKVVMALNMIDVSRGRGISIDEKRLSELLGIPVVPMNGKKGVGVDDLLTAALDTADQPDRVKARPAWLHYGTELEEELELIEKTVVAAGINFHGLSTRWIAMKLLEGDTDVVEKVASSGTLEPVFKQVESSRQHLTGIFADTPDVLLTDARYGFISGLLKLAVRVEATDRVHLSENIDKFLTHRLLGPAILLMVLYLVYTVTFQGSEPLVKAFDWVFKSLGDLVTEHVPEGLFRSLLKSGIIDGVGGVLSFTPLIAFMFMAIAVLEDTGYMARIAFMLDRVLRGFGLHGASMLALMVSGGLAGGCAVPGIMATRTMKEPKERLVTILVSPLMNCGAKLPVYALLIGAFFPATMAQMMFLLTLISWALALLAGKVIRSTVLAGPSAPFVLELPPYRVPTLRGILIHTWERTWMYVKKAGTVILAVSILLWSMMTFPGLPEHKEKAFESKLTQLAEAFLANPGVTAAFTSEKDLREFEQFRKRAEKGDAKELVGANPLWLPLSQSLGKDEAKSRSEVVKAEPAGIAELKQAFSEYEDATKAVEAEKQSEGLKNTVGGRIGIALETITKPLGFDWRTNVALVGGFAAKEVVVATLGTAYSLGEVNPEESGSLSDKLKSTPGWNPLTAFTLIMFVMLYNPCITTLVVIKKESGKWRWTLFAMVYTTVLAYVVAWLVHTVGALLNLGVS